MPARKRPILLLDLDGTLVDPAPGIIGSTQYVLREFGLPVPEVADLHWVIGPPLRVTFAKLLGGDGDVEAAVRLYRERYGDGALFDATPYPTMLGWIALATALHLPALAVQAGRSPASMPTGVQIVGPANGEDRLFDFAAAVEDGLGGFSPPR